MWKYLAEALPADVSHPPRGGGGHLSPHPGDPGRRGRAAARRRPGSGLARPRSTPSARASASTSRSGSSSRRGCAGVARLDFGTSMWTGSPIWDEIKLRFALSLQVAIMATLVAVVLAIPLGMLAALRQDTLDRLRGAHLLDRRPGHAVVLARHPDHPGLLVVFKWLPPMVYTPFWVNPWQNLPSSSGPRWRWATATRRWPPA